MENEHTHRVDTEFSTEWMRANPDLFAERYYRFFSEHKEGWAITANARPGFLTLIATRVDEEKNRDAAWLQSGSLLYRLSYSPFVQNCDEINVTMANGSRESGPRVVRAYELKTLLEGEANLKQALRWALEWIDAVPDNVVLPGMPGFDRDYVDSLLEEAKATDA